MWYTMAWQLWIKINGIFNIFGNVILKVSVERITLPVLTVTETCNHIVVVDTRISFFFGPVTKGACWAHL